MYKFADGTASEVEVNEEIGAVILDSRRVESNRDKMEQRHCYSYDAVDFEGEEYGSEDYYECLDSSIEENARIRKAFDTLSEVQQRRLLMLASGLSIREIARRECVDHKCISRSIELARKKIEKNF